MKLDEKEEEILKQHLNEVLNKILKIKGLNNDDLLNEMHLKWYVEEEYFDILDAIEDYLNLIERAYKEQEKLNKVE